MADIIKILGHSYRLQIIEFLDLNGKSPVHQILDGIGGNQASLSQHLNKMRSAGIITSERRGKEVWYEIAELDSLTILNCMRKRLEKHALETSSTPTPSSVVPLVTL
jgi:ArsR family transcriptional regulator